MIPETGEVAQMKTRGRWFGGMRIPLFLVGLVCLGVLLHGVHFVKPQDVQTAIAQSLSPGADETAVHQFMDTHHILYTGYSQELRRMYGKIYRTSLVGYMKGRILVQFSFDEQGRMESYRVVEVYDFLWE